VDALGDSTDTVKKKTETFIDVNKQFGLEINAEDTEFMLLSGYHNAGKVCDTTMAN
jgi:hypothetical protein